MSPKLLIRPSVPRDAEAISRVIVRAIRETTARDDPPETIASAAANFSPERAVELMTARDVLAHRAEKWT